MKKSIFKFTMQVFVGCMMMILAGCSAQENKLAKIVKEANKQCPIEMEIGFSIERIAYENGNVVFTYVLNDEIVNVGNLKKNPDLLKQSVTASLSNPKGDVKALLDLATEENVSLHFVFKGKQKGEIVDVSLTPDELKTAANSPSVTPEEKLKANVEAANATFPQVVDPSITVEKMVLEGSNVVYYYKVDEDIVGIDKLKSSSDGLKSNVRSALTFGGQAMAIFIEMVLDTDRGIVYRYVGNKSGEQLEILFAPDELREILKSIK